MHNANILLIIKSFNPNSDNGLCGVTSGVSPVIEMTQFMDVGCVT
ncbi:hypothetical protein [Myroides marinus]|nr:hypothetical protein [Myroides marinus]